MVRGRILVPRFSIRQFSHRDQFSSKQPFHRQLLFAPRNVLVCERQLSSSSVLAQRGQQRRDDRQQGLSAATILEDEKRGVFRVIDISPAKREERKRFKRFGEDDPVPPPRAASMLPTQRCWLMMRIKKKLNSGGEMFGLQQEPFILQLFLFRSVFHFHIFETLSS